MDKPAIAWQGGRLGIWLFFEIPPYIREKSLIKR
jgi:hypothetical protein